MERRNSNSAEKKGPSVGTFGSIVEIVKNIFRSRKKQGKRKLKREDILAGWITLAIVIVLGIILWFIPATNGFIRSLIPFIN